MTVLTAMEISTHYPADIRAMSAGPNELGKYSACVTRGPRYKLLISTEAEYDSSDGAIEAAQGIVEEALGWYESNVEHGKG